VPEISKSRNPEPSANIDLDVRHTDPYTKYALADSEKPNLKTKVELDNAL
jgi:hypothetical protein